MSNQAVSREASLVEGLSLAAAPTFAVMALLTGVSGAPDMLCAAASPLSGMTAMYALMSAFHLAPWLRLLSRRRSYLPPLAEEGARRADGGGGIAVSHDGGDVARATPIRRYAPPSPASGGR